MSGYETPAGWYPDSTSNGALRWWDGAAWTDHFHVPDDQPAAQVWNQPAYGMRPQARPLPQATFLDRNRYSLITLGLAVVYLALNTQAHIILFGFIPISMGARALGRKEQLAVAAMIVAVGVLIFGITSLTHPTT